MRLKPPKHSAVFFALILLVLSFLSVLPVKAAGPLTFIGNVSVDDCGPNGTCPSGSLAITTNDLLMAAEVISQPCNQLQTNGIVVSSSPSETWTIAASQQFTGIGGSPFCLGFITATAHSTASYTFSIAGGTAGTPMGPATFLDYRGTFNGFGSSTGDTLPSSGASGSDTLTMNVAAASVLLELDSFGNSASNCGSTTTSNGQSLRHKACNLDAGFGLSRGLIADTNEASTAGAGSIALTIGWSGWGAGSSGGHLLLEMKSVAGAVAPNITTLCFGNCGSPAVTLANTNSTHTVAFNQSITLFYEFQPQTSGFMLNVTTNLAKNYANSFFAPSLAFYGAGFCPIGASPGSAQCPFQQLTQGFTTSFAKGAASIAGGPNFPVTSGQWYAMAISSRLTGLDVNDTNTNVQMFQTTGLTPPVIGQSGSYGLVKIGLWTWIQAAISGSLPPPAPATNCAVNVQLDCLLTGAVNSFCSTLTVACQTSSALLWLVILAAISFFSLIYVLELWIPGINLSRLGLGEIGILIFLAWFAIFTSFTLIPVYLMILTFFIVSLMFGKRVASYV